MFQKCPHLLTLLTLLTPSLSTLSNPTTYQTPNFQTQACTFNQNSVSIIGTDASSVVSKYFYSVDLDAMISSAPVAVDSIVSVLRENCLSYANFGYGFLMVGDDGGPESKILVYDRFGNVLNGWGEVHYNGLDIVFGENQNVVYTLTQIDAHYDIRKLQVSSRNILASATMSDGVARSINYQPTNKIVIVLAVVQDPSNQVGLILLYNTDLTLVMPIKIQFQLQQKITLSVSSSYMAIGTGLKLTLYNLVNAAYLWELVLEDEVVDVVIAGKWIVVTTPGKIWQVHQAGFVMGYLLTQYDRGSLGIVSTSNGYQAVVWGITGTFFQKFQIDDTYECDAAQGCQCATDYCFTDTTYLMCDYVGGSCPILVNNVTANVTTNTTNGTVNSTGVNGTTNGTVNSTLNSSSLLNTTGSNQTINSTLNSTTNTTSTINTTNTTTNTSTLNSTANTTTLNTTTLNTTTLNTTTLNTTTLNTTTLNTTTLNTSTLNTSTPNTSTPNTTSTNTTTNTTNTTIPLSTNTQNTTTPNITNTTSLPISQSPTNSTEQTPDPCLHRNQQGYCIVYCNMNCGTCANLPTFCLACRSQLYSLREDGRCVANSMATTVSTVVSTLNNIKISGAQPFYLFLDRFQLYNYHPANYTGELQNVLSMVDFAKQFFWTVIRSQSVQTWVQSPITAPSYLSYTPQKFQQIERKDSLLLQNTKDYFLLYLPVSTAIFFLLNRLFYLIRDSYVSSFIRVYSFWMQLWAIVVVQNVSMLWFFCFGELGILFSLGTLVGAMRMVTVPAIGVVFICCVGFFMMSQYFYGPLAHYFTINMKKSKMRSPLMLFRYILKPIIQSSLTSLLTTSQPLLLSLILSQFLTLLILISCQLQLKIFKSKLIFAIDCIIEFLLLCLNLLLWLRYCLYTDLDILVDFVGFVVYLLGFWVVFLVGVSVVGSVGSCKELNSRCRSKHHNSLSKAPSRSGRNILKVEYLKDNIFSPEMNQNSHLKLHSKAQKSQKDEQRTSCK